MTDNMQPMSLMTIEPANKGQSDGMQDLLTIRVLETSERKMQLIRQLLTPEEYNSIAANLVANEDFLSSSEFVKSVQESRSKREELNSVPAKLDGLYTRRLVSIGRKDSELPVGKKNLYENLEKKRQAIEFFFIQPDPPIQAQELTIELRSGHFLGAPDMQESQRILSQPGLRLTARLEGLLGLLGIRFSRSIAEDELDELDKRFIEQHEKLNNWPYTNPRNLLQMRNHLAADNQLDRYFSRMSSSRSAKPTKKTHSAEFYQRRLRLQGPIASTESADWQPSQACSPVNAIKSVGGKKLSNHEMNNRRFLAEKVTFFNRPFHRAESNRRDRIELTEGGLINGSYLEDDSYTLIRVEAGKCRLTRHNLMLAEEVLAMSMVELDAKLQRLETELLDVTRKAVNQARDHVLFVSTFGKSQLVSKGFSLQLGSQLEARRLKLEQLEALQQQQVAMWRELESTRQSQGFQSSSLQLLIKTSAEPEWNRELRSELARLVHFADICDRKDLEQQPCLLQRIQLDSSGSQQTPDAKCPNEEVLRRRALRSWIDSLTIKLLIGARYSCSLGKLQPVEKDFVGLSRDVSSIRVEQPETATDNCAELSVEILQNRAPLWPLSFIRTRARSLAKSKLSPSAGCSFSHKVKIDETTEISLDFVSTRMDSTANPSDCRRRSKHETAIKRLYRLFFATSDVLDTRARLHKLMNRIDWDLLAGLVQGFIERPRFVLDPLVDAFNWTDQKNLRERLLMWRWASQTSQPIQLDERELSKNVRLQSDQEELKWRLLKWGQFQEGAQTGYKLIEQIRSQALLYLRHYEQLLLARTAAPEQTITSNRQVALLFEPQLHMIDLAAAFRLARALVPKPSARRPLMPRRKQLSNQLATLAGQDLAGEQPSRDLESQVVAQWQRFTSQQQSLSHLAGRQLQLVVSIQQASNVPMRVLHNTERPNTPTSPISFLYSSQKGTSARQKAGTPSPMVGYLLQPPTCYVELAFQRQKRTSSLASGPSPAWNETIFLPVELAGLHSQVSGLTDEDERPSLLVDEFLQLNLYDYHFQATPSETGLLEVPRSPEPTGVQQKMVVASQQRVERHLLGSLRIPLTTLLSTGRIEGSFALSQPLFLDNYQIESANFEPLSSQAPGKHQTMKRSKETCVQLFITLDPPGPLLPIQPIYLSSESYESQRLFEYTRLWERTFTCSQPSQVRVTKHLTQLNLAESQQRLRSFGRHVRALVLQREARYCLACRLLGPLEPPDDLWSADTSQAERMRAVARFVSLLNPRKCGIFQLGQLAQVCWFDAQQTINRFLGGAEERALLLCNYFLHLGLCSALLTGDSLQDGRCVYVIVWHNSVELSAIPGAPGSDIEAQHRQKSVQASDFLARLPILIGAKTVQLWNPNTGRAHRLNQAALQLISVGAVISVENVYANLQSVEAPGETNYDIRLSQFWFPLLPTGDAQLRPQQRVSLDLTDQSKVKRASQMSWRRQLNQLEAMRRTVGRPADLSPIVRSSAELCYERLSQVDCSELKQAIERAIKSHLLKWRPQRPTYFNRTLSRQLEDKLALMEPMLVTSSDWQQTGDWKNLLAELVRSLLFVGHLSPGQGRNSVISWPANLPYSSLELILDSLHASGVHDADLVLSQKEPEESRQTQFLVACHVQAFPARVMSVWLYVAALVKL